jgi:hypothetical protein
MVRSASSTNTCSFFFLHFVDRPEDFVERADGGAAAGESMPRDNLGEPRFQRAGEAHDTEGTAEHAGRQHCRFGHADHGKVEQFAGAAEAGIAESSDEVATALCQHFECCRRPDGRLDAGSNEGHVTRRRHGMKVRSRTDHQFAGDDEPVR